ncbi:MAG: GldG family protein [Candidatus Marinimicrobia bacterium]|nr:GldG family protein [Candidatus Neomarinimicrobiota bacterium]
MKFYRWLLITGIGLIFIGLIIYSITNLWDLKTIIPLAIGLGLTIFSLIKLDFTQIIKNRRFQYGSNAIIVILLVVAIVGLLDFFLARHTIRIDTTASKIFSLSDQTRKILKNLDKDVTVLAFVKDINKESVEDLLKEYAHLSKHFKYELIDPDEKPAIAKRHRVKAYGNLVIICNDREEQIDQATEEKITNAIIKVTREEKKKVYFVSGHGEGSITDNERYGFSKAKEAILEQNYEVEDLLLADKDSIPDNASVIVLPGPKKELFEHEKEMLKDYIDRGGSVLLMLDPRPSIGLIEFLKPYGVQVGDDIVIDASGLGRLFGAGPDIPLVANYGSHPIVSEMGNYMTFFPGVRSVRKDEENNDTKIKIVELAKTSPQSYAVKNFEEMYKTGKIKISKDDEKGPIPIAVAVTKNVEKDENKIRDKARLVVVGDSDFATNAYFSNQANGDLFMNMINWLLADEDLISIRPKSPDVRTVNMTPAQVKTVFWLTVIILPAISFIVGVLVYIRRR